MEEDEHFRYNERSKEMICDQMDNRHARRSAARAGSGAAVARIEPWSRFSIKLLALLALAIQMLVVQTHIHISQSAGRAQIVRPLVTTANADGATIDNSATAPRDNYPIREDPANCPLCQELTHSGQFVHSAAVLISLPFSVTVNFIPLTDVIPSLFSVSHNWQGRAPPQA